jgi:hypothetical protein
MGDTLENAIEKQPFTNDGQLLDPVIPFFERVPRGRHLTVRGFVDLPDLALSMNGGGRFRQVRWNEIVGALRLPLDAVRDQPVVPERIDDAALA